VGESRGASIAARSAGDWAGRRVAGPTRRARRTSDRRIVLLYPTTHLRVLPAEAPTGLPRCRGSEVRREPHIHVRAAGRPRGRIGERRRDAEPDLQQEVVTDGEVAGELRARGAEPREARCLPGVPGVARVAEQVEPQLV